MNGVQVKDDIGKVENNGGIAGDNEAVVGYWSAQMAGLLEDLRSVRIGGAAEKTGGAKDKAAGHGAKDMRWKPCEQATEYRTLHRPGPNGTAVHTTWPNITLPPCRRTAVRNPNVSSESGRCALRRYKLTGPFILKPSSLRWPNVTMPPHRCEESRWPNISMPPHRCEESRYIKRVGENFHLSFMRFKVPWPLSPQEFALIFVTVYDAASGMTVTVLRTNPVTADFTNRGYSQEDAPAPLPGHVRMGISGGYAVKDMGEGRAHMRCIFTLDLKFPPALVNFIIQQCGGILYQWFTEELARIYDDPYSTKGKAFRQALHDEPLYNHVRAAMEKYRAARAAEQQQLEAEQQRKHQELVGGQQNGQAAGERIILASKEDEEKSFRELGAEVEAKIESLVASVSRRASSNGSIDEDGVEIVEGVYREGYYSAAYSRAEGYTEWSIRAESLKRLWSR
ncbi:unnamed protein product [Closterium sp. Naga37s-1]|nr:unnamed protein product [Closterium sp. Naga37s-1]